VSHSRLQLFVLFCTFVAPAAGGAETITGAVVDQSGRALPRAHVRLVDKAGAEVAAGFADETGTFRLTAPSTDCRVDAILAGFQPGTAPCSIAGPVRIVLSVAPISETVVVTATSTDTPASQSGASVTSFTAADLERRRQPLVAELLRTTPGAMLVRAGAPGALTSLFVRGGESSYNKVLLDGIPLNEPGGVFNFSNLTTENLDRVEVVRGAHSALFGSDAMASVVQLFTRRADPSRPQPAVSASLEGGTFGTYRVSAAASGAAGTLDYAVGGARLETDNEVPNNKFNNTSLSANLGIRLAEQAMLRFIARAEIERAGVPGATAFGRPDLDAFFDRDDIVAGASFDQQLTSTIRQRAAYSVATSGQTSTNLNEDPPFTPEFEGRTGTRQSFDFLYDTVTDLDRHHGSYQVDWRAPRGAGADHLLTSLADWDGERIRLRDRLAEAGSRHTRNNLGVSLQHQALWRRAFVTWGGRVEHNDSFGTVVVPRASAVFIVRPASGGVGDTRVRAGAGLGIKEPTALQSFSLSPFFLGNKDLEPERSRAVEVGLDQRFAHDRVRFEVAAFANRFRNLISLRTTDPAQFFAEYANIGMTRAHGAEFGFEVAPIRQIHARAGYTFLDSKIITSTSPTSAVLKEGAALFRRPKHSGFVSVVLALDRLTVDLSGVIVGRFVDSDFGSFSPPIIENPGFDTWNARLSYSVTAQLTIIGSVDNLTDERYMEPLGYPALGRAGRVGVRVRF
jgi:outer membrane cobalamin receptor